MKKIFISSIFLCFFAINFAFSQSVSITPNQYVNTTQTVNDNMKLVQYGNSAGGYELTFAKARGTAASPLAILNGDNLMFMAGLGYNGSNFATNKFYFLAKATENWTSTANGNQFQLATTPNGSTTTAIRMVINHDGNIGIGTTSPQKKLHITYGSSGVTPHASANSFFEDNTDNYINIAAPDADATGVLFGKTTNAAHGGIVYTGGGNMQLRTGGNQTRVNIDSQGKVGIGTTNPDTRLHIDGDENDGTTAALKITSGSQNMLFDGNEIDVAGNGSIFINNNSSGGVYLAGGGGGVRVGANGTGLSEIMKGVENIAAFSIGANACFAPSPFPFTNAAINSTVFVSPDGSLASGVMIAYARVTSAGNVQIRFCNTSNVSVTQPVLDYHITVIR